MQLTKSFAHHGILLKQHRGVWSGINVETDRVAVSLWTDAITETDGRIVYDDREMLLDDAKRGAKKRLFHLNWAWQRGLLVRVVNAIPRDPTARPREILTTCPETRYTLEILKIDQRTGAFVARAVPAAWQFDEELKARLLAAA